MRIDAYRVTRVPVPKPAAQKNFRGSLPRRSSHGSLLIQRARREWPLVSILARTQLDPGGRVITRPLPAAHVAVDPGLLEPPRERRVQQQVIDAQAGIALIGVPEIIPEGEYLLLGMQGPNRIRPALLH